MAAVLRGKPAQHGREPSRSQGWGWRRIIGQLGGPEGSLRRPVIFLLAASALASWASPAFLRPSNLGALVVSSSFLVVATVGESFVILAGSIDLGVESVLASAGMFAGWLTVLHGMGGTAAVLITLAAALALGTLIGWLVSYVHIPSFIVTLGTYWGMRGVALLLHGGAYISPDSHTPPRNFGFEGLSGNIFGLSDLAIIAIGIVLAAQILVSFTPLGLRLRAVGSNETSARRVGVKAGAIKVGVFAASALLAAVAGITITAWQGAIYPLTAQGYSLEAIAAVILGGIPFTGGRGTIVGAALGALLIGVINDVIVLLGLPSLYEYVFVAVVLVVAGLQARGGESVK